MDDPIRKGAWIASTKKHLDRLQYSAEVAEFSATEVAGKASHLLASLQADSAETIFPERLKAYSVTAKIRQTELNTILSKLEADGRIEVKRNRKGDVTGVDVYTFAKEDVLRSGARIFDSSDPTLRELASIDALEHVCYLPRTESELMEYLCNIGFEEEDAEVTIKLQEQLTLVGIDRSPALDEPVLFNEHAFVQNPSKIAKALKSLNSQDRQTIIDIQNYVENAGAVLYERLIRKFSPKIINLMEGLGLLDKQEVLSPIGNCYFVTLPQTFGVFSGKVGIGVDSFHHAKMLLCCITFGSIKSTHNRGRIKDPIWIINALLRGDEVGPCTAIGEDYTILEHEGVISLRLGKQKIGKQFFMRLRKKEVGELARQILSYRRTFSDAIDVPDPGPATGYVNPQEKRAELLARRTRGVEEIQNRLLVSLRT
jgi:hypothetical protein